MKRILFILLAAALVSYGMWFGLQRKLYHVISQETLIGIIRCIDSPDKNYSFYLYYFPIEREKQLDFKFFKMKGKDWVFEGEIIKWKRPLNAIGFKTAHRPIRICDSKGTSYYLEEKYGRVLFKIAKILPGVDTSFISAVRQTFAPKIKFGIYATNTGYLVRKIR